MTRFRRECVGFTFRRVTECVTRMEEEIRHNF